MTTLGFIGAGNMGMALIKGFSTNREKSREAEIYVYDALYDKREHMRNLGFSVLESEVEIAKTCKYIVLACKPLQVAEVLDKIKEHITTETVFISLCAGITAECIRGVTDAEKNKITKVVLVMPNMPMLLGEGASALSCDESVSNTEFAFVRSVIESCGWVELIPRDKMNEVICINASSPAFIYLYAKYFIEYAEQNGINPKAALNLFAKTLIGASKMMTDSGSGIDALIEQVSSKGGTTLAGLEKFYSGGLEKVVKDACEACTKKAYELGAEK
ncbi:MAG: pyrroline-5-carboxylate reductase [Oscillospiraceae bacterium]|nr:pyrroline-5-carboxylate reductase [Oscillospiraceae bacterium]